MVGPGEDFKPCQVRVSVDQGKGISSLSDARTNAFSAIIPTKLKEVSIRSAEPT